jgi:hypothetical protein
VLHCPYCHGYEVRDRPLGVLATGPLAMHQASLIPDWGPTILFTDGRFEPDAEQSALLDARGVTIERVPVAALVGEAPALRGLRLADGRQVPVEGPVRGAERAHGERASAPARLRVRGGADGTLCSRRRAQADQRSRASMRPAMPRGRCTTPPSLRRMA